MKAKQSTFKFVDLFSGCGGFSYGLEMAGHQCLLGVDFEKDAIQSFKANHPQSETFFGDIQKLTKEKLTKLIKGERVDMVVGGPPCQGFSTIGKGEACDNRNNLFREFVRIVKTLNPRVIIFENVTGILAKKNQVILKQIFKSFEDLGYTMDARVLSSEEYGVAEIRRRTIIIGTKECSAPLFPQISHGERGHLPINNVGNVFSNLKADDGIVYNHDIKTAQIKKKIDLKRLERIPEGCSIRYERDELKYLPKSLKYNIDWESLFEGRFRQAKLQRLDRKKPSPTILTSRTNFYHPTEDRFLTPREAAACQSFPNNFIFSGSLTSQFRQIGNAVPPLLAKAIGEAVRAMLLSKHQQKENSVEFGKYAFHYNRSTVA